LGKNLAYHEMRLILAKLIWTFDFGLEDEDKGEDWLEQRVLLFWEKKPLVVRVKDVRKST
jgi:cytochrome P450